MKTELQQRLYQDYPNLFSGCLVDGCIAVGDGWHSILRGLCSQIDWWLQYNPGVEPVVFEQIKEKFGTLRISHQGGDDYIRGAVRLAEDISGTICEKCGQPGKTGSPQKYGWMKTYCSQHWFYLDRRKPVKEGAVAIDFDGVINSYQSNFVAIDQIPDPPTEGALEAIQKYLDYGFKVYIYSTRNEQEKGRQAIRQWLLDQGVPSERVKRIQIVSGKPIAKIYLDDRAWHFSGRFPEPEEIHYYRPWHGGSYSSQK